MDNTVSEEFYATDDTLYVRTDNRSRTEEPQNDNFDAKESISISYDDFYRLFEKIEDELEFTKEDDYYLFSYYDTSQTIFDALKDPYNANVSGIEEDAINHEVQLKVDKDNFYFMEFEDKMSGETVSRLLQFDITHNFSDINDIDEIEVPDGV